MWVRSASLPQVDKALRVWCSYCSAHLLWNCLHSCSSEGSPVLSQAHNSSTPTSPVMPGQLSAVVMLFLSLGGKWHSPFSVVAVLYLVLLNSNACLCPGPKVRQEGLQIWFCSSRYLLWRHLKAVSVHRQGPPPIFPKGLYDLSRISVN